MLVGDSYSVNVLLTAYLLFLLLLFVTFDVSDVFYVRETQYDHEVVDKLDFNPVVEQNGRVLYFF